MELEKQVNEGKEVSGFLSKLIASGKMSQNELYSNISDLMAAAVDTVRSDCFVLNIYCDHSHYLVLSFSF